MSQDLEQGQPFARSTSPSKGEVGASRRVGVGATFSRTPAKTARPRELRANATRAEQKLWSRLRNAQVDGASFRRQHPMAGYYLDFWCPAAKLAIELDGGQHGRASQASHDAKRTAVLDAKGVEVIRFWNVDVLTNIDGVLETIAGRLRERSSTPTLTLPLSGGGDDVADRRGPNGTKL